MATPEFSLTQEFPGIFLLKFADHIELCAHFLRFQEYYECPEHAGKNFQLIDYIKWYARRKGSRGTFTYFSDWNGFNIPTTAITELMPDIVDVNSHDMFMATIATWCQQHTTAPDGKAYLIGTSDESKQGTHAHELAHGLWYTNVEYATEQGTNLLALRTVAPETSAGIEKAMRRIGYGDNVVDDEVQAYMATGLRTGMNADEQLRLPFINTFMKFTKQGE